MSAVIGNKCRFGKGISLQSNNIPSMLALVTVVLLVIVIVVQVLEINYYGAAPSVWPI